MARKYGKANHRKILRIADCMADEAKQVPALSSGIPDWAGLAWIVSPYYNWRSSVVCAAMGAAWTERALRIVKGLQR